MSSEIEYINEFLKKDATFDRWVKIVDSNTTPITLQDLHNTMKKIQLNSDAPEEVKEIFEISKKLFIFGYFYYRFFTVSHHYAFLAVESALRNKYKTLYGYEEFSLKDTIDKLSEQGIIPAGKKNLYDTGRKLRNALSHLTDKKVSPPDPNIVAKGAELINSLYQ